MLCFFFSYVKISPSSDNTAAIGAPMQISSAAAGLPVFPVFQVLILRLLRAAGSSCLLISSQLKGKLISYWIRYDFKAVENAFCRSLTKCRNEISELRSERSTCWARLTQSVNRKKFITNWNGTYRYLLLQSLACFFHLTNEDCRQTKWQSLAVNAALINCPGKRTECYLNVKERELLAWNVKKTLVCCNEIAKNAKL